MKSEQNRSKTKHKRASCLSFRESLAAEIYRDMIGEVSQYNIEAIEDIARGAILRADALIESLADTQPAQSDTDRLSSMIDEVDQVAFDCGQDEVCRYVAYAKKELES